MEQGDKKIVGLEEGWSFVATGLSKIRRAIDGGGEGLSSEESSRTYCTALLSSTLYLKLPGSVSLGHHHQSPPLRSSI